MKRAAIEEMFSEEPDGVKDPDQRRAHQIVNYKAKELAHIFNAMMPRCEEKQKALDQLKQALTTAHEAIKKTVHIGAPWKS